MNKHIAYDFVLILIIIQCVKSQDNNSDQPPEDEEEDNNFDVLDLDEIIQDRLSRFDDPQYQTQYQQLQEYQHPTQPETQPQPLTQPQQYDLYQGESQGYQPELLGYQPELLQYQHEAFGQYQPESSCYQTELLEYDPYKQYQTQTQEEQLEEPQHHYYGPPLTQTVIQTQSQEPEQYYGTAPIIQPQQYPGYQPELQGYDSEHQYYPGYQQEQQEPQQYQTDTYGYYEPPAPTQQEPEQPEQYYITTPPPPQPTQPDHYYVPAPIQTVPHQPEQYYGPPTTLPQPTQPDQYYVPSPQQTTVQPSIQPRYQYYRPTQPIEERDAETGHETTQKSIKRQSKPRKRKRTQDSGDQTEKGDGEESVKRIGPLPKKYDIKFYKRNYLGKLEKMIVGDYIITYTDTHKTKYNFYANLEQIECGGEIVYEHTCGTPYCSSLNHSKRTEIIIMTNTEGFTIINKTDGEWTRTDHVIPDYVKFFTQDEGGNDIIITSDQYNIDFTSLGSFRYAINPGVRCHKVQVGNLVPWKKTEDDDGFPELIYVSPKLTVIVKFYKYTKVFEKRGNMYQYLRTNKNLIKAKYT